MATKTISLKIEAWERLRQARRTPDESFSDVVLRAEWPDLGLTARELRAVYEREGPHLTREALDRIDQAAREDESPRDKWTGR
ncbi:MAG: hypothetical protein WEG36_11945 [Gemmatimonadota bacterium]